MLEAVLHSGNKPGRPSYSILTSPKLEPPPGAHGQLCCSCPKPQSWKEKDMSEPCLHPHSPEVDAHLPGAWKREPQGQPPGTRKPGNGVKNLNVNIQNLNLDFERSMWVPGGNKGYGGHGQAGTVLLAVADVPKRNSPAWDNLPYSSSPAGIPALPLHALFGQKMAF